MRSPVALTSLLPHIVRWRTMRLTLTCGILAALAATSVSAQPSHADSSLHLRVGGDVVVPADAREGVVIVVRGNARIEGSARVVIVVDGSAEIVGGEVGDLSVIRGRAELSAGAVVDGDMHLLDSEITRSDDSRVTGEIERGMRSRLARDLVGLAALLSLGTLLAMMLGGVITAAVAPAQLRSTGAMLVAEPWRVVGAAALLWIAMPLVAAAAIPTIIGLPLGLGYFLFVLPVLGFVGLMVSGLWIGDAVLRRLRADRRLPRPTVAAALGIFVVLLLGHFPLLGLLATVAVMLGSGAAALALTRAARRSAP
jgi:hypothetical protein